MQNNTITNEQYGSKKLKVNAKWVQSERLEQEVLEKEWRLSVGNLTTMEGKV